ncbi:MAG: ATP-dependent DNA ligase [Candidatus Micrarchaeaceae archaeon]
MLFSELASYYQKLEDVSSRLKMIDIMAEAFKNAGKDEIKSIIYMTEGVLAPAFEGLDFGVAEKLLEEAIAIATGLKKESVEKAYKKYGDMGTAAQELISQSKLKRMSSRRYSVLEVYSTMSKIAATSGSGSKDAKIKMLAELLAGSSPEEAKYLARYPIGQLRLGAGDSTILEALSVAFTGSRDVKAELENAYNICSDLGYVGEVLSKKGIEEIRSLKVGLFRPIRPALAERLPTAEAILKKMGGKCAVEQKYDGFRCQVHKFGKKVKIYSRNLEETTDMLPDIAKAVINEIPEERIIFEGEALGMNEATGEFLPFQETIQRKRKHGITEKIEEMPLHLVAFDIMYLNGKDLMGEPYEKRRGILEGAVKSAKMITPSKRIITESPKELEEFFETSIEGGLEGIVAKDLNAPYIAGARKFSWIKMKRSYKGELSDTLDLVIVGYFLGRGSRTEFKFGGLLCASYNKKRDMFETISKIGTGFTEANMSAFYELLSKAVVKQKPVRVDSLITPDFWIEPKYVVTVKADEITKSPMHTCGMHEEKGEKVGYALRFPRIVGDGFIRKDKSPEDATSTLEVIEIFKNQKRVSVK